MCKRLPSEQTENTNKSTETTRAAPQRNLIKYHVIWADGGRRWKYHKGQIDIAMRNDITLNSRYY